MSNETIKVAIPYKYNYELNDKVDEFNIFFSPDKNDFSKLVEFVQKNEDKRINIQYRDAIDTKTAIALSKLCPNIAFRLKPEDMPKVKTLVEANCKIFFDSSLACSTVFELYSIVNAFHVSDVYIVNELFFNLPKVSQFCKDNGVQIRIIANRALVNTYVPNTSFYYMPFVRPNDYDFLKKYIDVYEFDCMVNKSYDFKKLKVLYKIYVTDKDWYGDLQEINPDINFPLPNRSLLETYTPYRVKCGLRCCLGGHCKHCETMVKLAQTMRDNNMQFRQINVDSV